MERLHEDDLVGHVLAQEEWEVVRFSGDRRSRRGTPDRDHLGAGMLPAVEPTVEGVVKPLVGGSPQHFGERVLRPTKNSTTSRIAL
jgi:hypothetical protein